MVSFGKIGFYFKCSLTMINSFIILTEVSEQLYLDYYGHQGCRGIARWLFEDMATLDNFYLVAHILHRPHSSQMHCEDKK